MITSRKHHLRHRATSPSLLPWSTSTSTYPHFFPTIHRRRCSRCFLGNWSLQRQQGQSSPARYSSKRSTTTRVFALLLFVHNFLGPDRLHLSVHAGPIFTPRYNAGSIVAGNILYVVAGTLSVSPTASSASNGTSDDTLAIPLNAPFPMSHCPWKKLSSGYAVPEASAVAATLDQNYLVLAGVSNQVGQLVVVYEIATDTWSYLPPKAVSMAFPATGRSAVGIALDSNTGQMVFVGGLEFSLMSNTATPAAPAVGSFSISTELDMLDTRSVPNTWTWSAVINTPTPQPATASPQPPLSLVQPVLVFLPTLKATLVMGGCNGININSGNVTECQGFDHGYLINSMITQGTTSPAMVPISAIPFAGQIGTPSTPPPRISPCVVLLPSGQIFMYGGAAITGSLNDAWLLNPLNWTWTSIQIMNMPIPGRAGAACQMAAQDQMILVGGFDGGLTGTRQFSDPQLAVINTTSWTWTSSFTPDNNSSDDSSSGSLPAGTLYGIISGVCVLLVVAFFFFIRWYLARRYQREGPPPSKNGKEGKDKFYQFSWWSPHSQSRDPLMRTSEEDRMLSMGNVGHGVRVGSSTDTLPHLMPPPLAPRPTGVGEPLGSAQYPLPPKPRMDNSPFLVTPYAPPASQSSGVATSTATTFITTSMTSSPFNTSTSNGAHSGTGTTLFSPFQRQQSPHYPIHQLGLEQQEQQKQQMQQRYQKDTSSPAIFSQSERLPQDLADMQQGFYNKTQQHNKQYEMRRQNEIRQHPELDRSGTVYSLLERVEADEAAETNQRHLQQQFREVNHYSRPAASAYSSVSGSGSSSFYPIATSSVVGFGSSSYYPISASSSTSEASRSQAADPITTMAAMTPRIPLSTSTSSRSFSIPLREIEVGEESIQGQWNGLEDGTLLMSSHLETSALTLSQSLTTSAKVPPPPPSLPTRITRSTNSPSSLSSPY